LLVVVVQTIPVALLQVALVVVAPPEGQRAVRVVDIRVYLMEVYLLRMPLPLQAVVPVVVTTAGSPTAVLVALPLEAAEAIEQLQLFKEEGEEQHQPEVPEELVPIPGPQEISWWGVPVALILPMVEVAAAAVIMAAAAVTVLPVPRTTAREAEEELRIWVQ
jgi:hypothetical protein